MGASTHASEVTSEEEIESKNCTVYSKLSLIIVKNLKKKKKQSSIFSEEGDGEISQHYRLNICSTRFRTLCAKLKELDFRALVPRTRRLSATPRIRLAFYFLFQTTLQDFYCYCREYTVNKKK